MAIFSGTKVFINQNREAVHFAVIFFSCVVISGVVYAALRHNSILVPFLDFNTHLATDIWNLFGHSAQIDGSVTSSSKFTFKVTAECTSIVPTAIFISGVLAWPSTIKEKLIGIAAGIAALFVINLIRILTLFWIGSAFPGFLDIAHYFIWQGLIVILALGLWLFWTDKMVRLTPKSSSKNEGENE